MRNRHVKVSCGAFDKYQNAANKTPEKDKIRNFDDNPVIRGLEQEIARLKEQLKVEWRRKATVVKTETIVKKINIYAPKYFCWDCNDWFRAETSPVQSTFDMFDEELNLRKRIKRCPMCGSIHVEKETDAPPIHWGYDFCHPLAIRDEDQNLDNTGHIASGSD